MRRILVVYWYPTNQTMRSAVRAHLRALDDGGDRVIYHNAALAPSTALQRTSFDGVVLHNTFLGVRWNVDFDAYRSAFAWLGDLDVPKVAIPQDEYDHSEVLDEWLTELRVSTVLSNFDESLRSALYPTGAGGAAFRQVLTGYIDADAAARIRARTKPLAERPSDIVYRAAQLPYWFGSHGQLKHRLAPAVERAAKARGLRTNISTRWEDTILGDAWWDFLLSGRSVIGCESGSSVLDRRGETRRMIEQFLRARPEATFEEVDASMPSGWDAWRFFAISPRHLEAVVSRTTQVLVVGAYSGVLEAGRHFVPLARDLSNLDEVVAVVEDVQAMQVMVDCAYEEIFCSGRWSYDSFAEAIRECLGVGATDARGGPSFVLVGVAEKAAEKLARLNATRFPSARWAIGFKLTSPNPAWLPPARPYVGRATALARIRLGRALGRFRSVL
jgi:hypothetical protein